MTRDEVMALTDEDLRIKAAELMRWEGIGRCPGNCPHAAEMRQDWDGPAIYGFAPGVSHFSFNWKQVPDYPNDIAAAWELVDHMQRIPDGGGPRLEIELSNDIETWQCQIGIEGWPCKRVCIGYADTAPRAIARAFILAMEEE